MKDLLASGFLFVGGAILMTVSEFGNIIPFIGASCVLIGGSVLLYLLLSKNDKYSK